MKLEDIEKFGKQAQGQRELIAYLEGEPLNKANSIKAKCYECCNLYADGRYSCNIKTCPLYAYMPYNPNRTKKEFTDEQLAAKREQARIMRAKTYESTL